MMIRSSSSLYLKVFVFETRQVLLRQSDAQNITANQHEL
jgi:hypothetical protein